MNFKDFQNNTNLEYTLFITVNDETAIKIEAYSLESLLEQLHKIDNAVNQKVKEQYLDSKITV